jgi:hypothetical protein
VKNDYGTEEEVWALNGLEEPLKKDQVFYLPVGEFERYYSRYL